MTLKISLIIDHERLEEFRVLLDQFAEILSDDSFIEDSGAYSLTQEVSV